MRTIIWDGENGLAVPELKVESSYHELISSDKPIRIGCDLLLTRFRLGVKRKEIEPFMIEYSDMIIKVNADGLCEKRPSEGDLMVTYLLELFQ